MFHTIDVLWGQSRQLFLQYTGYRQGTWGATQITKGIFIGNLASSFDNENLKKNSIDAIVCCVNGIQNHNDIPTLHIPLSDHPDENFKPYFDKIVAFAKEHENVLFHCSYGVSRSTTAALAVILSNNPDLCVPEALSTIKEKRPCACPNKSFIKQLIDWQTDLNFKEIL